jgi:sortase A
LRFGRGAINPLTEETIARVTHIALNVMSLVVVVVGLVVAASFILGSPFPDQQAAAAAVDAREPEVPAITPEKKAPIRPSADELQKQPQQRRLVVQVPEDKTLRITVPEMKRVRNSPVPYASGTDENAFRNYVGVHLKGTGFPWQRQANVYIAGHRLGYVGTPSFLGFWDLNEVNVGDKIYVTDSLGRHYDYKVFKDYVVDPTDVAVTRPIKGRNILSLQTCTLPDYSRRLIIQAERLTKPASFASEGDSGR